MPSDLDPSRVGNGRLSRRFAFVLALVTAFAGAASLPYDESADAKATVAQALAAAKTAQRPVLLIFGANWCEDCRVLDQALKQGRNATLVSREFEVVKVDVGRFNRNLDVSQAYGDPIKKGIPAAVILSGDNRVLYSTKAGELANARRMSETGLYDFLESMVGSSLQKP